MGARILQFDLGNSVTYFTPAIPDESEILYSDLPVEQQFWRTPFDTTNELHIPSDREIRKMDEIEKIGFVEKWRNRWVHGMWFMNKGVPTYINGLHVDHLVFNKFNGHHLAYISEQMLDFYFRELVLKNDDWDGMQWLKPRRYGMTQQEITTAIYVLLSGKYHHVAIQSDTQDKARTTILTPLIETYIARPQFMREMFYKSNGKTPIKELKLKNPVALDDDEDPWLGGIVSAYPTNEKALDGKEFMYVIMDEMSKVASGVSPLQMLSVNKKTVRNYGRIGKVSCLSTTGDSDNVIESVKDWVKLAGQSTLLPGQRKTNSGLVKRFVSAIWSLYLDAEFLPDKYGQVDVQKNTKEVERIHNLHAEGTKDYYFEQRRLPLKEDHALMSASEHSYFRKMAIARRLKILQGLRHDEKPYVRGELVEKTTEDGYIKVYFEFKSDGPWMVAVHPYQDFSRNIDTRNRFRVSSENVYFPVRNPEYLVAYDPVRYDLKTVKTGHLSRASIIVHKKYDYYNIKGSKDYCADRKCALFIGRKDKVDDLHHEFCKAMKYFGARGYFERQIESVLKYVESQNMMPMILCDPKDGIEGLWMAPRVIDDGLSLLVARYGMPQEADDVDHIEIYPFEDGLIDMDQFDRQHTTAFDVTMSEIVLEHGLPLIEYTNATDDYDERLRDLLAIANPERNGKYTFQ